MELFKEFARDQENAQDQLNENFGKLENIYEVLFEGSAVITAGNVGLSKSIFGFRMIEITMSFNGNLSTAKFILPSATSSLSGRMSGVNLTDATASSDFQLMEATFAIEADKFQWQTAKQVTNGGSVTNNETKMSLVNITGWY